MKTKYKRGYLTDWHDETGWYPVEYQHAGPAERPYGLKRSIDANRPQMNVCFYCNKTFGGSKCYWCERSL